MSLYGGIKFSLAKPGQTADAETEQPDKGECLDDDRDIESKLISTGNVEPPASSSTTPGPSKQPQVLKPGGKSSAALKFAPRIRQTKPASGRPPASVSATTYSAEPVFIDTQQPAERTSTPVAQAPAQNEKEEVVLGADGQPLAKAPAMTLAAAKRARGGDEERKKKKKKKRRRQQPVMSDFKPDEQYDPNRPNDLAEYQYYRKKLKEERRAQLAEAKRRKDDGHSSGESSYYTDSEEDVPRRDAPKTWAPPKIYDTPPAMSVRPPDPPRAPVPAHSSSGDDAYARRLAMSQTASGDEAFARRQALSAGTSQSQDRSQLARSSEDRPPPPPLHAQSGDDAYARRMAMSQTPVQPPYPPYPPPGMASPPPAPPPSFAPAANMPPFPPSCPPPPPDMPPFPPSGPTVHPAYPPPPPPTTDFSGIPGFGLQSTAAPGPQTMASDKLDQAQSAAASGSSTDDFARLLEEKRKAAASIAEKLRNLGPPAAAPPVPSPEPDTQGGTFAEKMMRKWGHKEGTGLGADGSGIVHALTAEHVAKPVDPKQPLSKRQLAKQKAAAANAKNRKWVQHATNRGKIVNAADAERKSEEVTKYGEASRIICLVGLVGSEDEIDEDLSEEIGEECSKYGIVERVVQHLVEPPPPDPVECLRVFIVFSGMAGAWRSIKELDGRFFGGRKIRATYMDEARFDRGERDGPLL